MRFEKDKQTGDTVKITIYVQIAFVGIILGLAARYFFGSTPRYLLVAVCLGCALYMGFGLLKFIRFYRTWENSFLSIEDDRVRGLSMDPGNGAGTPFEIGLQEVEDVSLQEVKLTGRTVLPALVIRTEARAYHIVGIQDMHAARSQLLPKSELF